MISAIDKKIILDVSARYKASKVLLFGSCIDSGSEGEDIDLAVEGIPSDDYFRYYGELMMALSKPVDVVDLSAKSKFTDMIKQEGIVLYG